MFVKCLKSIKNYRNLSGVEIFFDKQINFIVGENNIGKTNVVELLNAIFKEGKFDKDDFDNELESIDAEVILGYSHEETGFFDMNFDPENEGEIHIIIHQNDIDTRIEYSNAFNMHNIPFSTIKHINCFYYDSLRSPSNELRFTRKRGNGKILNYIVEKSLANIEVDSKDIINYDNVNKIKNEINKFVKKIDCLMLDGLSAHVNDETNDFISRILELGNENNIKISELGDGVQYALNIILSILNDILDLKRTKDEEAFRSRMIDIGGKLYYPIMILLDEPEIHQHPARQRIIIKKIKEILSNENTRFNELLYELFGIDGLLGQMFAVTHSPNILLNDYHQFVRMYYEKCEVRIVSGATIDIEITELKKLFTLYSDVKSSFFSKSVILFEGDTEKGAFPVFADKMGIDFDVNGTHLISLNGAGNVKSLLKILKLFKLKAVALIDRDKYAEYSGIESIYFTQWIDYEEELLHCMTLDEKIKALEILEKKNSVITDLKKIIPSFNPIAYLNNSEILIDSLETHAQVNGVFDNHLRNEMKSNKNQVHSYLIASEVNAIPGSVYDVINSIVEK